MENFNTIHNVISNVNNDELCAVDANTVHPAFAKSQFGSYSYAVERAETYNPRLFTEEWGQCISIRKIICIKVNRKSDSQMMGSEIGTVQYLIDLELYYTRCTIYDFCGVTDIGDVASTHGVDVYLWDVECPIKFVGDDVVMIELSDDHSSNLLKRNEAFSSIEIAVAATVLEGTDSPVVCTRCEYNNHDPLFLIKVEYTPYYYVKTWESFRSVMSMMKERCTLSTGQKVIGMDCEWDKNDLKTIAFSNGYLTVVVNVSTPNMRHCPLLLDILTSSGWSKIGVNIEQDVRMIERNINVRVRQAVDTSPLHVALGGEQSGLWDIARERGIIHYTREVDFRSWSGPVTTSMLDYAAIDAVVSHRSFVPGPPGVLIPQRCEHGIYENPCSAGLNLLNAMYPSVTITHSFVQHSSEWVCTSTFEHCGQRASVSAHGASKSIAKSAVMEDVLDVLNNGSLFG